MDVFVLALACTLCCVWCRLILDQCYNVGSFCAVNPEDMKKLSGTLTALSNEKAKALKVCSNLGSIYIVPSRVLTTLEWS